MSNGIKRRLARVTLGLAKHGGTFLRPSLEQEAAARLVLEPKESFRTFADRLKALMSYEPKQTQESLAKLAGVTQPTVANWLNNDTTPYPRTVDKLWKIFGVQWFLVVIWSGLVDWATDDCRPRALPRLSNQARRRSCFARSQKGLAEVWAPVFRDEKRNSRNAEAAWRQPCEDRLRDGKGSPGIKTRTRAPSGSEDQTSRARAHLNQPNTTRLSGKDNLRLHQPQARVKRKKLAVESIWQH